MTDNNSINKKNDPVIADKAFIKLVLPSILGIVLCMICLVSLTWAWFTEDASANTTIKAANYTVTSLSVVRESDGEALKTLSGLEGGVKYTVTVETNDGPNTNGFWVVRVGTVVIKKSESAADGGFDLVLESDSSELLTATAFWGTPDAFSVDDKGIYFLCDDGNVLWGDAAIAAIEALKTETESDLETETETETEAESEAATESQANVETEANTEKKTATEMVTELETSGTESAEQETVTEPKSEIVETSAEAETEATEGSPAEIATEEIPETDTSTVEESSSNIETTDNNA